MPDEKGNLLAEGKTKRIWELKGSDREVIVETKDTITAFDDPTKTRTFATKAVYSTETTCRVFDFLSKAGIPVAYQRQLSPTEFVALKCKMLPLEAVARRYGVGSYLKRHPELCLEQGRLPHRFHRLVVEFFLKTTKGELIGSKGNVLLKGLDPSKGEEDPLIADPHSIGWQLLHSKKPRWDESAVLGKVSCLDLFKRPPAELMGQIEDILRRVFLVLEGAWKTLGMRFIDLKIELGFGPLNQDQNMIYVADVIDNDSWRLRDENWQELSKENFRQGKDLAGVEKDYNIVADLVNMFRVPSQVLVLWMGSPKDEKPKVDQYNHHLLGVNIEPVVLSGHKQTRQCLDELELLMSRYPDGGVIVAKVGRSNGLAPILASHTTFPVIATFEEPNEDVWSSIKMASSVPLMTAWPEGNAVQAALNILAQKNPLLYAKMQGDMEKLDI